MNDAPGIDWTIKPFDRLNINELYDLLKLRVDVFVVEQHCAYPEMDDQDRDPGTLHLMGRDRQRSLVAYLRILPPGLNFRPAGIGRVVVAQTSRGLGICDAMVKKALAHIHSAWPGESVRISAQTYLKSFYESLGFKAVSDSFLEDGIPHIDMIRKNTH